MYRVFGSPYNLSFHQSTAYLRQKRVPFAIHNSSMTGTKLMAMWHRAKMSFCTLTPKRESLLLIHQVVEKCEAEYAAQQMMKKGSTEATDVASSSTPTTPPPAVTSQMLINAEQYPKLNLMSWAFFLYASSWLGSTGSMYRWVHGKGSSVVDDYVSYLSRATSIVPGAGSLVGPRIRNLMVSTLAEIGIVQEAEPYMIEHFQRLCHALEEHFKAMLTARGGGSEEGGPIYVLGTSHPTLADVALGAAFDGYFLRDDPPAMDMLNDYPYLYKYLAGVTDLAIEAAANGDKEGGDKAAGTSNSATTAPNNNGSSSSNIPGEAGYDHILPTLQPILDLMTEIFPWQIAQCDALKQYAGRGLAAEKVTVVDVESELPLSLWGRKDVVGASESTPSAPDALVPATATSGKVSAKLLMPKCKGAPYVMLIDRSIIPAHTRCQEVELAQVCAMGAVGTYPLVADASGMHACGGASDAFLSAKQRMSASDALYALAADLLRESDAKADTPLIETNNTSTDAVVKKRASGPSTMPAIDMIDFDTHHLKSAEATRKDTIGGHTTSVLRSRAKRGGQLGNKHEYDVKKARALAETKGSGSAADGGSDGAAVVVAPEEELPKYDTDVLLEPSASVDFALARVAMLLGRMFIKEYEVRSVFRNRGIEFAVIPRKH